MRRKNRKPAVVSNVTLDRLLRVCPFCGGSLWIKCHKERNIFTLDGPVHVNVNVCECSRLRSQWCSVTFRSELEGRFALAYSKYGLDLLLFVGEYMAKRRSYPAVLLWNQLTAELSVTISTRSRYYLRNRYRQLTERPLFDETTIEKTVNTQPQAIIDAFRIRHPALDYSYWLLREWCSGTLLRCARVRDTRLAESQLTVAFRDVFAAINVPVTGIITDGDPLIQGVLQERVLQSADKHRRIVTVTHSPMTQPTFDQHALGVLLEPVTEDSFPFFGLGSLYNPHRWRDER